MADAIPPLVVGNWKMWGPRSALPEIDAIATVARAHPEVQLALCLPATLIDVAVARAPDLMIGAQDCHAERDGAYTGCVSASLLREAGASIVLVGHSERRRLCGERDADVCAKLRGVRAGGLRPILCVGEPAEERDRAADYVCRQLAEARDKLAIAYEPIWAIGAGRAAEPGEIAAMHATIGAFLHRRYGAQGHQIPVLYGGSVDPANAAAILGIDGVAGVLVGAASRDARSFASIVASAQAADSSVLSRACCAE